MTEDQAHELVQLIRAATADSWVSEETLGYFETAMLHLDYEDALAAARVASVTWDKFLSWGKFKEIYRAEKRLREPAGDQRSDLPQDYAKRGDTAPEWVHVWSWLRTGRETTEWRFLPQQYSNAPEELVLTDEEYLALRDEWIAAGSPKSRNPIPMAR